MSDTPDIYACPRCDQPLHVGDVLRCKGCKVDYPRLAGMPWLFSDPDASLGEWRGRLHSSLSKLAAEAALIERELKDDSVSDSARTRTQHYLDAVNRHRKQLQELLQPLGVQSLTASHESYLALRTRIPPDQGLNTYYANLHRDWCWGDEENAASLREVLGVLGDKPSLGKTLVLGAGAGRLAYDLHEHGENPLTVAFDFNPLLALAADRISRGESLSMIEFPIAPKGALDNAVSRELSAPNAADDGLQFVLGDALRPPFASGSFDTVVTPWLIDIITEDLPVFAARIHQLIKPGGRWLNFGSLAFASPHRTQHYSEEEVCELVNASGFSIESKATAEIPYMCSPASRHGRRETVFTFAAEKSGKCKKPPRHRALPDWIVTGKEPVPLSPAFQTQAMSTQVYAFIMSLIDGKRSIDDMAAVLESKRLMTREEAIPAIRGFLIRMHDDANQQATL